jgi:Ca2+-binding RTX toxin-like protein
VVDNSGDKVIEEAGQGADTVKSSVNFSLGAEVESLMLTGTASISGAGNGAVNWLGGNDANNSLYGAEGNDTLEGKGGNDTLVGGLGADKVTGGAGADKFAFASLAESTAAAAGRDTITDFSHANGDLIDLGKVDANGTDAGDGAFRLVAAFDGSHGALTIAAQGSQWLVSGDVNGDKVADFAILVASSSALIAADFVM